MQTAPRRPDTPQARLQRTLSDASRRPGAHVVAGLALAAAAVVTARVVAGRPFNRTPADRAHGLEAAPLSVQSPPALLGVLWPPLFLALTMSGLRVWNAPPSRQRSRALTLWGLALAFNALWMALGPRRFGGNVTTAVATLGTSGAYAWEAHRLYAPPDSLAAAPQSWRGFTGALGDRLRRRRTAAHNTVH